MLSPKNNTITDSPVEKRRKELPRGNGEWAGFESVYITIARAAEAMGNSRCRLSELHVSTMAILGCGEEETMKAHLAILRQYGWIDMKR